MKKNNYFNFEFPEFDLISKILNQAIKNQATKNPNKKSDKISFKRNNKFKAKMQTESMNSLSHLEIIHEIINNGPLDLLDNPKHTIH